MDKKYFLMGNAHLDPVWQWRVPEGLALVKSTFKAALDRMEEALLEIPQVRKDMGYPPLVTPLGISVSAPIVDTIMMILVIHPSCLNMRPAIPLIIVRGRNTASIVKVEAITEIPTSCVACTAASFGLAPLSRCVEMFSNTTMASSTTIPMAMESEDMDTMFNVLPVAQRYISEARSEIGIASTMMNVARHLPRKR